MMLIGSGSMLKILSLPSTEVTSSYGVLSVMGPQSIEFLQPLTDTDLSKEAFGLGLPGK